MTFMSTTRRRTSAASFLCIVASGIVAACSEGTPVDNVPLLTASDFVDQEVLSVTEYRYAPPYANADPEAGEALFAQCRVCHSIDPARTPLAGPPLYGIFGRGAASTPGFPYSPTMAKAGFSWTPAALDAWLAAPQKFLPGNQMPFAGIYDSGDRRDLIAYLLSENAPE